MKKQLNLIPVYACLLLLAVAVFAIARGPVNPATYTVATYNGDVLQGVTIRGSLSAAVLDFETKDGKHVYFLRDSIRVIAQD